MSDLKKVFQSISVAVIPFIFLLSIGLIEGDITYHQKVFKTFMIFIFDAALFLIFIINIFGNKEGIQKEKKYLTYFAAYFIFVTAQFIISFFSGEISYDREYHLGNYLLLITLSLFFFLYLTNLDEVKIGLMLVSIFFVVVMLWSIKEFKDANFVIDNFRPKLSFGNTDYFSGYAIGLIPLAFITPIILYDTKKKFFSNYLSIIFGLIAILGIIPIYFSQTRSAMLGLYVGFGVIFIPSIILMISKLPWKVRVPLALILPVILIAVPVLLLKFPPPIMKSLFGRLVATMGNPSFYIHDRLNGWSGALGLFLHHPIFGAGLGTVYPASFKYIGKYFYLYSSSNSFKHAHSEYMEVLGEAGIIGIITFFILFGLIIVLLMRRVISSKYIIHYRFISLGVVTGLVCMLIHQIFSLSLRMSVTMTAWFFLLGLGIFLISYSRKALVDPQTAAVKTIWPEKLNKTLNIKETYILLGTIAVIIIAGTMLFMPVFRSEYNMRRALPLGSQSNVKTNYHLKRAVEIKSNNPYAWTQKWEYDLNFNLRNQMSRFGINEKYFDEVRKDLDTLNKIIPGYQDVWSKYANLYMMKYGYSYSVWQTENDPNALEAAKENMKLILKYINKSLDMNYLNAQNHIYRLLILAEQGNDKQHFEALKDYIITRIFLDFAQQRRIIKDFIKIKFTIDPTNVLQSGRVCTFNINDQDLKKLEEASFKIAGLQNIKMLDAMMNSELAKLLTPLYAKIPD